MMTRTPTRAASSCSDLLSLLLSGAFGAALLANIPMMPFWGLLGGFETTLVSAFAEDFFCSGSGGRAWRAPLACCSSREDMGTAPEQRMAPYLLMGSGTKCQNGAVTTQRKGRGGWVKPQPAAVLQIVLHGIVVDAVERTAVPQQGFLHAVNVDTDDRAHPGFNVCQTKQQHFTHFSSHATGGKDEPNVCVQHHSRFMITHLPTGLLWQQTLGDPEEQHHQHKHRVALRLLSRTVLTVCPLSTNFPDTR